MGILRGFKSESVPFVPSTYPSVAARSRFQRDRSDPMMSRSWSLNFEPLLNTRGP